MRRNHMAHFGLGLVILLVMACVLPANATPTEKLQQGIAALDSGNVQEAVQALSIAAQEDPDDADVQFTLGLALSASEQHEQAVVALTRARDLRPDHEATRLHLGIALVALKRYEQAVSELAWVFERAPQTENLGVFLGMSYFLTNQDAKAVDALTRNVSEDAKYEQLATYYLGLAQNKLGRAGEARDSLARASRLLPGSDLSLQAQSAAEQASPAEVKARRFRFYSQLAGQYDDNVRLAPKQNVFGLRDQRLDSPGLTLFLRPEYALVQEDRSELTVHYAGLQVFNFDISELDFLNHQVGLTFVKRGVQEAKNTTFGVTALLDQSDLGRRDFLERFTISPFVTIQHKPTQVTSVYASIQTKNFINDPNIADEVRDSDHFLVGAQHYFISTNAKKYLKVGFQFDNEDTDGQNYDYDGIRPLIGAGVTFGDKDNWSLTADYQRHHRDYKNRNSIFNVDREDDEDLIIARLEHKFDNPSWRAFGEVIRTDVDSTIALFAFERSLASAGITYRY